MKLTIASWNIEGRLTRYSGGKGRGTPEKIIAEITRLNADIVVLPEAYLDAPASGVDQKLSKLGYKWYDTKYMDTLHDDDVVAWGYPFMRILYKMPIESVETRRWGDVRNLPLLIVKDTANGKRLHVIATHLDDLTEDRRLQQVDEIVDYSKNTDDPIIMLGDFNAMWRQDWRKLLASSATRQFFAILPSETLRYVLTRLSLMAIGTVMERLKNAGLTDADPKHRPTTTPKMRSMPHMPSIRLVQIDHILTRGVECGPVTIGKDGGSDHRSLCVEITVG